MKPSIAHYQIESELGRGGMGVVYKCFDLKLERHVALKVILKDAFRGTSGIEQQVVDRFFNEAKAAAKLSHPGIVTIYEQGEDRGQLYIAMELVKGCTLTSDSFLEQCRFLNQVIDIGIQIADILAYAHHRGIVHRDIKPENIMYRKTGQVVITDFGVAHIPDSHVTVAGELFGTPAYMAPEQIKGLEGDYRADLYALGILLYWLIMGSIPYKGNSLVNITYKIINTHPPDIILSDPELSLALNQMIHCMVAKNPEERYSSGLEIADALRQLFYTFPDIDSIETPAYQKKWTGSDGNPPTIEDKNHNKTETGPGQKAVPRDSDATVLVSHSFIAENAGNDSQQTSPFDDQSPFSMDMGKLPADAGRGKFRKAVYLCLGLILFCGVVLFFVLNPDEKEANRSKVTAMRDDLAKKDPDGELGESVSEKVVTTGLSNAANVRFKNYNERRRAVLPVLNKADHQMTLPQLRDLLKLKVGFANTIAEQENSLSSKIHDFIDRQSRILEVRKGACDMLMSLVEEEKCLKLIVDSNIYGNLGTEVRREELFTENMSHFWKMLDAVIQRNYCFNALSVLSMMSPDVSGNQSQSRISIIKERTVYKYGDLIDICYEVGQPSYFLMLNVNLDGIYLLYPRYLNEDNFIDTGISKCSGNIEVSPPFGVELIFAVGVVDESLLSPYRYNFNESEPFHHWTYEAFDANDAQSFCDFLVYNFHKISCEKWHVENRFIRTVR